MNESNYIDKTVMEEQAKERGAHSGFFCYGRLHRGFHSRKKFRTSARVKICRKLS